MPVPPLSVRALRALLAVSCAFPAVQACGGRSDTEEYLFGADVRITVGANAGSGSGGTSTAAGGSPSAVAGQGNSTGVGAAVSVSVGGSGSAGLPGTSGNVTVAGGSQGGFGAAGVAGAGSAGAANGTPITCGADVCDSELQSCCAGLGGLGCIAKGQACPGAVLGCTTNADCGEDICCISITGEPDQASSCKARCDMGTSRDRQLCQVAEDCRPPFRFCTPTIFGVNICTHRP